MTAQLEAVGPDRAGKETATMISANISKKARRAVYAREGYACALCDSTKYLQVHHCVKRSQGGTDSLQNLICLCADCHALAHGIDLRGVEMTQADMEQAITEFLAAYYAPDWNPWGKEGP